MAAVRTVSIAKSLLISNSCFSISRRSITYAAVSCEPQSGPRPNSIGERSNRAGESDNSWAPDPITGFYRPVNRAAEIDVADLRNMLLKNKIRTN